MFSNNSLPFTMNVEPSGNGNGFWGGDGAWFIWIILIFAIFGGWGNGYGGTGGVANQYTLASDFATLQRQIDTLGSDLKTSNVAIGNGISSLGYDQLSQFNNINTNINAATNAVNAGITALGNQMQNCCCDMKYQSATQYADLNYKLAEQSCATRQAVADGTRSIIDNDNANYRALDARITGIEMSAKDDKIADLTAQVNALTLAASQQAQNNYIVNALRMPTPVPSYTVPNPFAAYNTGCGCPCNYAA